MGWQSTAGNITRTMAQNFTDAADREDGNLARSLDQEARTAQSFTDIANGESTATSSVSSRPAGEPAEPLPGQTGGSLRPKVDDSLRSYDRNEQWATDAYADIAIPTTFPRSPSICETRPGRTARPDSAPMTYRPSRITSAPRNTGPRRTLVFDRVDERIWPADGKPDGLFRAAAGKLAKVWAEEQAAQLPLSAGPRVMSVRSWLSLGGSDDRFRL